MEIRPSSDYVLVNGQLVLKKSSSWALRILITILVLIFLVVPHDISSTSYQQAEEVVEADYQQTKMVSYIKASSDKVTTKDAERISEAVVKYSDRFGIEPAMLLAVAKVESTFDKHAISSAGAFGILQVLPRWHIDKMKVVKRETGNPEIFDIETNIYLGSWILKDCSLKHRTEERMLLCYNGSLGTKSDYAAKVLKEKRRAEQFI